MSEVTPAVMLQIKLGVVKSYHLIKIGVWMLRILPWSSEDLEHPNLTCSIWLALAIATLILSLASSLYPVYFLPFYSPCELDLFHQEEKNMHTEKREVYTG